MLNHPAQSLFIGCFPMGAATLINAGLVSHHSLFVDSSGLNRYLGCKSAMGFRWQWIPLRIVGFLVVRFPALLSDSIWDALYHVSYRLASCCHR